MKRKAIIKSGKAGKKLKITELSEEDDDYDSSVSTICPLPFIDDVHVGTESDEEESRDEEEFEDVDSDDLALMNENKVQNSALQSRKSPKKDEKVPASKVDKGSAKKKQKSPKTEESQEEEPSVSANTTTTATVPKKRTVAGGTVVEDTKLGHGPEAKPGKMVSVYYIGREPFRFRLGTGEVIKGWDTGLIGMKVGGKRKITVPPAQGYGNSRQGPIPPGSTLMFDVELKAVS
ncbi:hypothetical protein BaRGS_00007151 [Batillaria attramentaria]|uniref:peptidylprolyl isomerase n=1 Tax=Batillaria attramentaria TaxID=370345 RepID=A0ABD0LR55_9CAEN